MRSDSFIHADTEPQNGIEAIQPSTLQQFVIRIWLSGKKKLFK